MVFVEYAVYEILAIYAGWIGITELSAMALILNLGTMTFTVPFGLHLAVCVFVGNSMGEGNSRLGKRYASFSVLFSALVMIIFGLLFILIRDYLPRMFTSEPTTSQLFTGAVFAWCINQIPDSIQIVFCGILKGLGKQ